MVIDSPVYADSPVHQACSVETLEGVTSLASSSVALKRRKFGVRNKKVVDELKRTLPVAALSALRSDFRTSYS